MQLDGHPVKRYTGCAHILRRENGELVDLQFAIVQLDPQWEEEAERQLPPPTAPINGRTKDASGAMVPTYNEEDPEFLQALAVWQRRQKAKRIHDANIDDRISWETDPEILESNPKKFYDGIWEELRASFARGEINRWVSAIVGIDQVGGADIALAEESLFRELQRLGALSDMEEEPGAGKE